MFGAMTSQERSGAGSVAFDRAAGFYDATRGVSAQVEAQIVAILNRELTPRGRCLEIGVGTGRIGLPLYRSGVDMTGLDLSRPMMEKLIEKAAGSPFPLIQGTATRLPFRDDVFGGGLIVHVLHLIPEWREAVAELVRVVRPGGVVVTSMGDDKDQTSSIWDEMQARFRAEAGLPDRFPGFRRTEEIDVAMDNLGAVRRDLESVPERKLHTPGEVAGLMGAGVFSFTWALDADALGAATERLKTWAIERYGSLDKTFEDRFDIPWRAYDLP
jgi:ubiquinone/menaquinone biosynthesis C-methylase UbiE